MTKSPWVPDPPRAGAHGMRLFAFPYAGGGASIYRGWEAALGGTPVFAVQPPGREERMKEAAFACLAPLVSAAADALRPLLVPPFCFFGHSMGALIAFDLARELRRRGAPLPEHLFLSARRAPHLPPPSPPIHALDDAAFLAGVTRLGGMDERLLGHAELMTLLLPTLRADFAACETRCHTEEEPLPCGISAFCGTADPEAGFAGAAAWRHHTRGTFRTAMLPGGHFFLRTAQRALLREVARDLASRRAAAPPAIRS